MKIVYMIQIRNFTYVINPVTGSLEHSWMTFVLKGSANVNLIENALNIVTFEPLMQSTSLYTLF